jgi:putative oxidoreductase
METSDLNITRAPAARRFASFDHAVFLAGRLMTGLLFLWAGIDKIQGWPDALQEVAGAGLPLPALTLALTVALQLLAGAAIMLGRWLRPSCWALAAFTALATILYHGFWTQAGAARHAELITFMEHVCMVGGLLLLSTLGKHR